MCRVDGGEAQREYDGIRVIDIYIPIGFNTVQCAELMDLGMSLWKLFLGKTLSSLDLIKDHMDRQVKHKLLFPGAGSLHLHRSSGPDIFRRKLNRTT